MVQEILDGKNRPEEEVAETLVRKFGAYPAKAILEIDVRKTDSPSNLLPDFCLARVIQLVVDRETGSR